MKAYKVATSASHTPAHNVTATVAPFRAWRGLQIVIAGGPTEASITGAGLSVLLTLVASTKHYNIVLLIKKAAIRQPF